jgi:GT2 family glycosyltransferase
MGQSQVSEFKDDDYKMIESIVSRLEGNAQRLVEIIDIRDKSISEFLGILQRSSIIIAERGIAVVAGLALGVPTLAVDPYGGKNVGFAKLFDFDRFALSSANLDTGRLMSYLEDIITNYDSIVASLNCKVEELFTQLEKGTTRQLTGLKDFHPQVITTEDKIAPREASGQAKVSIIMVNYNGATFLHEELTEAVHSFLKTDYPQFEFIFVDNCSTDNSVEQVAGVFSQYPSIPYLILKNSDNLGFAGGCEEGLKAATGEYACLVNNDDKAIDTDWLKQLISVIQSDEKIGVAFCKKMKWDNPSEIDARGLTMNPAGLMQNTKLDDKLSDCLVWQTPVLIKRKIIDDIGGLFDEDYVVLNDDTDSSLRIWLAGYRIVYVPSAVVLHKRSATMKMLPVEFITFHGRKNTIQTVIKNYGLKNLIRWLPVTTGIYLTLYFYYLKIGRKDHARGTLRALTWNVRNFGRLMKKRRSIQKNIRKIDDGYVFSMMNRFNMIEVMKGDKVWPK